MAKAGLIAAARAAEIATAGVIAAAPAQQKPPGPMTVRNDKINTIIENNKFNDPCWGQNLLIDHARSARTANENDSSRSDLRKAEKKKNADQLKSNNELILSHMALLKRIKESKFAHDHERELRPYSSSPLFKSSYVNLPQRHGQRPTYVCKACDHETDILSNFKVHHKTKKHMANLNAWNEEENEISIDLHDQPLSKKQKTVAFARETAIAAKEAIHLHDQSTFLRNDNSDCVTNEESQLTQKWEKLAKDPQWRIVKKVMEPKFYHSQAGSDRQALHELQES
jgi:aspartate carbamoyltransferase regulatory subunit